MQPSEFCRKRLEAVMQAIEQKHSVALAQEVVLLSSLMQGDPSAASFGVLLRSLAEDPGGPNLARSAREVLAAWCAEKRETRNQERRGPARCRRQGSARLPATLRQFRLDGAQAAVRANGAGAGTPRLLLGRKGRRLLELHRRAVEDHPAP